MSVAVVLATHNAHKVNELRAMVQLSAPGVVVRGYDGPEPVEDGTTFDENALIKARTAVRHTGMVCLADDSGICVDVLGGAPGIFSAIWCGEHGRDEENLRLLLAQLRDIPEGHRRAHFHCSLAMVVPEGPGRPAREEIVTGDWSGRIAFEATGAAGFGYDPIFLPDGATRSSAELAPEEKNALSHRAIALRKAMPLLREL